jgi:Flp pilus assembly protein TadG
MNRRLRFKGDERGQATVEFALILPLLLGLVLGVIEFGRAWNLAQVATDAVRESTRRCVLAETGAPVYTAAWVDVDIRNRMAAAGVPTDAGTVEITSPGAVAGAECENSDQPVQITLRIPYSWMFFRVFPAITLTSSFTMRNE